MNADMAKAGNTLYVGLATVLNTIAGLQVVPSQTAKPLMLAGKTSIGCSHLVAFSHCVF
jgi:hypothetical protein